MRKRFAVSVVTAAVLAAPAAAISSGNNDGEIREPGTCTDSSTSKIKLKEDDGRLEVEFEVDQNISGDTWKVKFKNGSEVVFKGKATTGGRSGSFSIERKISDQSGTDAVSAVGSNLETGERCTAKASL